MASSDAPAEPVFPLVVREAGEAVWSEAVLQVDGGGSDDESGASTSVSIWRDLSTAATFLRAATDAATNAPGSVVHWLLLRVTIKFFEDRFLPEGRSIVTEIGSQDLEALSAYNFALVASQAAPPSLDAASPEVVAVADTFGATEHTAPKSALLAGAQAGHANLGVQFGGQGVEYLQELQDLYTTFPTCRELITQACVLLTEQAKTAEFSPQYPDGFDALQWVVGGGAVEVDEDYLNRGPASFPLIGLTQLANFMVGVDCTGCSLAEFLPLVRATTGHSQGLVSAIAISSATDAESFRERACKLVLFLQIMGCRCQETTDKLLKQTASLPVPPRPRSKSPRKGTPENPAVDPTTMLAVLGISTTKTTDMLRDFIVSRKIPEVLCPMVSLINGPHACVVTGVPKLLAEFRVMLGEVRATPGEQEPRVPHSQRKLPVRTKFLTASAPFHNTNLDGAVKLVEADLTRLGIHIAAGELRIPVIDTQDGTPLGVKGGAESILPHVAQLICCTSVNWMKTVSGMVTAGHITHVLDFGPGTVQSSAGLTATYLQGGGVHTVLSTIKSLTYRPSASGPKLQHFAHFADPVSETALKPALSWAKQYGPRLVRRSCDDAVIIDTKFSRLVGKPPVIVGGMTPTTSFNGVALVVSVANGGFHAELAGGGLPRVGIFTDKIHEAMALLRPGAGISLNLLYLNSKQWAFQFPTLLRLRQEGVPIESITIGAGVPSLEKAEEILAALQGSGVRYIAFKPGSSDAILATLEIAQAFPDMPVVLQWTGGRGGGHHSFEDMHEPILSTYQALRRQKNLVLVAGSGFGDAEGSLPYLTGSWSEQFGRSAMPFDGVLLGSRMMVATEARTSPAIKQLIIDTPGITNELEWETSYDGIAGGVITVQSELGEPIHKLATRGMMLWREFDKTLFSVPRGAERETAVAHKKGYIINRLNADFQKVYFGKSANGVVVDVPEMTHIEVLTRMVDLMYISAENEAAYTASLPEALRKTYPIDNTTGRWIDRTFRSRVFSMLERTESRFLATSGMAIQPATRVVQDESQLDTDPAALVNEVAKTYPQSQKNVLSERDVDFFYHICRFGGKPVNFIPVINADLSYWFKIDSLWYSEDLAAVPEHDAQRVCVLQGPVSVKYSKSLKESGPEILTGICDGWSKGLLGMTAPADLPMVEYLAAEDVEVDAATVEAPVWSVVKDATTTTVLVPDDGVSDKKMDAVTWLQLLSGNTAGWRHALFHAKHVVRGKLWVPNPVRKIFRPRPGQMVQIVSGGAVSESDTIQVFRSPTSKAPILEARFNRGARGGGGEGIITVVIHDFGVEHVGGSAEFVLEYTYHPIFSCAPLHEIAEGTSKKSQTFYGALWGIAKSDSTAAPGSRTVDQSSKVVAQIQRRATRAALGNEVLPAELLSTLRSTVKVTESSIRDFNSVAFDTDSNVATVDFAIVAGWKTLVSALFFDSLNGNLFELVHLSNEFTLSSEQCSAREILRPGTVSSVGEILAIENGPSGKTVTVNVDVFRPDEPAAGVIQVLSQFFYRGAYTDHHCTFRRSTTDVWVSLPSDEAVAVFKSKPWIQLDKDHADMVAVGLRYRFRISSLEEGVSGHRLDNVSVVGDILMQKDSAVNDVVVGQVQWDADRVRTNEVTVYLAKHSDKTEITFLESSGYRMLSNPAHGCSPATNVPYALASTDLNPIHRNEYLADLASLPGTITHGMWSSANAGRVVRDVVGNHVHRFKANFKGMVLPGTELFTELKHVGMHDGMKVVDFKTANDGGEVVLDGRAFVPQETTTYVFTGQGSAEVGMGMDLYVSSKAAKAVWDRADAHLRKTFSFSILDIVQKNPKAWTVNFGGRRGRQLLKNYLALETASRDGKSMVSLIPELSKSSRKYTFRANDGLLFATQFTQIALVLQEKAAFDDMKQHGLVTEDSFFAGHSLGEYAAVTSTCDLFSIEALVEIVFMRGLVMQTAVPRDENGRSSFGMVAASPMRVGAHFTLEKLTELVNEIDRTNDLLQVVNYNVEGMQYVVAGELSSLEILSRVMDKATSNPDILETAAAFVAKCKADVAVDFAAVRRRGGIIKLERGKATIPLPGIDVPFHSKYLSAGVPAFRDVLLKKMDVNRIRHILTRLEGRYIPNVVAEPFTVSSTFVNTVHACTQSPYLEPLLDSKKFDAAVKADKAAVARTILIELLAYQFASPVRWVETQHYLFTHGVKRYIEIGPGATLSNMAARTLQFANIPNKPKVDIFFFGKDQGKLYYDDEDRGVDLESYIEARNVEIEADAQKNSAPTASAAPLTAAAVAPPVVVVQPVAVPVAVARPAAAAAAPPEDKPILALDTLKTMLALKLKKGFDDILDTATIQSLVGGKSALQNEIIGDVEAEFGETPDGSAELGLSELAKTIGIGYSDLGKTTTSLVQKRVGGVLSAGFGMSRVKSYLAEERMLGPNTVNAVLLAALLEQPKGRFSSDAETTAYLDAATDSYAKRKGITIPKSSQGGGMNILPASFNFAGAMPSSQPTAAIGDEPVSALMAMKVLLALKLKKSLGDIKDDSTVTDLVGGKSAIQNELIGDFEQEFGDMPDGSAERPLTNLSAMFQSYSTLGKITAGHIQKMVSGKMPGGFGMSDVKRHLMEKHGLQGERVSGVLLLGLLSPSASRLSSETEAHGWLDGAAATYATAVSITLGGGGGGGGSGGGGAAMGMPMQMMQGTPEALKTHQKLMKRMVKSQISSLYEFLEEDPMEAERRVEAVERVLQESEDATAAMSKEHGDEYREGIRGIFNPTMIRRYDSCWNWARQEAVEIYHVLMTRKDEFHSPVMEGRRRHVLNRSSTSLLALISRLSHRAGLENNWRLSKWFQNLAEDMTAAIGVVPRFVGAITHLMPCVRVIDGRLEYTEKSRGGISESADYVNEMAGSDSKPRFLCLKSSAAQGKAADEELSACYFDAMRSVCTDGVTFAGRNALVTGCGAGSIGIEVVRMLLQGGARVVVTTSRYSASKVDMFRRVYEECGSRGSELVVLPFNQASSVDVTGLINYISDTLKWEIDFIVPFAAISENGRDISSLDDRSELSHRIMTTNLIRLLGAVKARKEAKGEVTRPAAVVLPLSPNHGVFGFDGLYAESKLGLESLFNKWSSESWEDYLVLAGAVIGWTRGTGLMAGNNIAARGVEERGCRTFSTQEMALNIVSLFHDSVLDHMFEQPVWADFGGGFEAVDNLNEVTSAIRKDMLMQASCERAVLEDKSEGTASQPAKETAPLASNRFEGTAFPTLPDAKFREKAGVIRGLINLEKTVVVVGFGEVGPWGSSRTRWEMEAHGAFTVEGCIEMAWLMGMISYFNGKLPDNKHYIGWIDTGTKAPIPEHKIKEAYETQIVEHAGVRLINSEQLEGYNPKEKLFLQQVAIAHDMDWIEVADKAEAMEFRTQLGAGNVDIRPAEGGQWEMKLKKGAVLHIPKAKSFDRLVAGQVPDGWDALRYGVPQDIVHQVDPVTLHTIVATGEALISAGITDPYEFYHYVHVSDVGNSSGGGMGGMRAIRRIFGERMLQKSMQSDILQESFINTMTAWVNMLLLSSSGPIKTPVGACATAAESVDIAVETILSGKAKVMVAGGYDGFSEESSYEFAQMKATSNSEAEIAMGREPKDMCRPTSTTRGGFMEAQGAGMQLLMTADLAVKMGCPIFGIVALTNTATDKVGRSVPAPGQGILTTARETRSQFSTPMLDVQYRKKNLEHTMRYVESWRKIESDLIEAEAASILSTQGPEAKDAFLKERTQFMERECIRLRADAQVRWGMTFYQDTPDISPLRGALSVWGLDVDDISVATFHGTGTKLNDKNESDVTNSQLAHLGRTKGNPCMVVCQKWLTGHPKGAAAAWMLNGALQMMSHGVVPGNRNADNVDAALEQFDHLLYPNRSLEVGRINAVLLKSFGFGQAGGEVLVVHPDYLLAALDEDQFSNYCDLRGVRERGAQRALHEALADKRPVVRVKTEPPYTPAQEKSVYLDPLARVNRVAETGEWAFSDKDLNVAPEQQEVPVVDEDAESIRTETEALLASLRAGPRVSASDTDYRNDIASNPLPEESRAPSPLPSGQASPRRIAAKMELAMRETAGGLVGGERGVGIDVEPIKTFEGASKTFINRNFTEAETAYCLSAPNPAASFAGRWAAKEAVIKAISSSALDSRNLWRDSAAPLKDIHVRRGESGAPYIELDGHAKMVAAALGVTKVQISISYFADNAVAQAVAMSGAQPK